MTQKKVKTENTVKDIDKKKTKPKASKFKKILYLIPAVLIVYISIEAYKFHESYVKVPDLPKLDLNEWWGEKNSNSKQDTSIRPYRVFFPSSMQDQLVKKFIQYKTRSEPPSYEETNFEYGVNSNATAQLFDYWQYKYKFNERQKYLNKYDHFKTNIQGLDVHFVQVKPEVDDKVQVIPILLMHGWPGSFRDFFDVIPQLIEPRPGYDFVFEVIVPSLPGFIYSDPPTKPGLSPAKIAIIMRNLMHRLGLKKYFIHGGDFSHTIASHMATVFPKEVQGFHSNFLIDFSPLTMMKWLLGAGIPSFMVEKEYEDRMYPLQEKIKFFFEESGYLHVQGYKPDSLGAVLNDSPVGLASYLLDKFLVFSNPSNRNLTDGGLSKFSMTDLLDNIVLYWATASISSAMRLHKESFSQLELENILNRIPTPVPTWRLSARHELLYQPEWLLKRKYPHLLGSTHLNSGGHYIAFEQPATLASDLFSAVNSFLRFK